ncbi:carboxymuconolactone decarboxylase family protein [Deinococcus pimensis]|uniref:carboxymuconolactone decarboxylase family protein n=1 Tax=Deinococcus pimensis TaxID=309888 RepID=UPI0004B83AA1|nr:carboxymuconolactone decarboxylase family protein [Deinococcus pimensis]
MSDQLKHDEHPRAQRGWDTLRQVDGRGGEAVIESLRDLAPDLGRFIVEFAFGEVISRPGLDLRTRELVTVAALTALGNARPQLKVHLHGALNVGCTREEVLETIIQMAVYAGMPAALNGVFAAREVFDERDEDGARTGHDSGPQ